MTDHRKRPFGSCEEEKYIAESLMMLSSTPPARFDQEAEDSQQGINYRPKREKSGFQCKSCKKVFASHQALGGHRASHKKIKGCFAGKSSDSDKDFINDDAALLDIIDEEEEYEEQNVSSSKQFNGHECTICHRVFSSGQALGGHKRCHWLTTNNHYQPQSSASAGTSLPKPKPSNCSVDLELHLSLKSPELPVEIDQSNYKNDSPLHSNVTTNERSSSWLQLASGDCLKRPSTT